MAVRVRCRWVEPLLTGFQPVVALWAEQDVVLADEFRNGKGIGYAISADMSRELEDGVATVPCRDRVAA